MADRPTTLAQSRDHLQAMLGVIGSGSAAELPCPHCGKTVAARRLCPECGRPLVAARRSEDVAGQQRFAERRRLERLERAWQAVPPRFRWARFSGDLLAGRVQPSSQIGNAQVAMEPLLAGSSLLLIGPTGSGKTSLACAIFRDVIDAAKRTIAEPKVSGAYRVASGARFVTAYNLAKAGVYSRLGAMPPLVEQCLRATLLIIDDLGTDVEVYRQSATSVREVLHERHAEHRPTIVTTYLQRQHLEAHYGGGIARRLSEGSVILLGDKR